MEKRRQNETGVEGEDGWGRGLVVYWGWGWGGEHLRIRLLLDNSQEDLSPTLESCEVCGSAHTPPRNWKRSVWVGEEVWGEGGWSGKRGKHGGRGG